MKEQVQIELQITDFRVIDYSLEFPFDNNDIDLDNINNYKYDITVDQQTNTDKQTLLTVVKVNISSDIPNINNVPLGRFSCFNAFKVKDFDKLPIDKNGHPMIPSKALDVMTSMTISACRGAMAHHFRGSLLDKAILPIVDMRKLKDKPVK